MGTIVEIFKTDVQQTADAAMLVQKLTGYFPGHKINFDLSDCDRILRVEGENILSQKIIELLNSVSFQCIILE